MYKRQVDGRMNVIYRGDFTVITDYAHTDDALKKVLSTLKPLDVYKRQMLQRTADIRI